MGNQRAHAQDQAAETARSARASRRRQDQAGPQQHDLFRQHLPLGLASPQLLSVQRHIGGDGLTGVLGSLFNLDPTGTPAPAGPAPKPPAPVQRKELAREDPKRKHDKDAGDKDEKQAEALEAVAPETATPTPDTALAGDGPPDGPPPDAPPSDSPGGPPGAGNPAGGPPADGPPASDAGDDPVAVQRQLQSPPGGDGAPAGEEMTPEEAERQVKDAKEKGAANAAAQPAKEKGDKGADAPSEGETEAALNEKADKADSKSGGAEGGAGKGEGSGDKLAGMAAAPPGDDSTLPGFADEMDGGRLAQYATERAWHDQWTQSAESSSMTTEDRAALVGEALLTGGVNGLTNAAAAILIDQVINRATKSIPYASGFIALGQLAYDPKAWVDGSFVQPGKNIAEGGSKVWAAMTGKGDVIDGLEGVVDILEGLNNLIGTISTICMIVAAVLGLSGVVLAIFGVGAALLSAAAICMKAGVFLGKISTIAGIIISALRVILIAARAIQIMVSDADPETQAQRAASLQQQTQKLTSETAQRYANKRLDKKAKDAAKDRESTAQKGDQTKGDAKTPDTGAKETVAQTEGQRGKITKALDLLSSGGFSKNRKEAKETWNKDSKEFAPKSHQAAIDKRRQEKAAPGRREAAQRGLAKAEVAEAEARNKARNERLEPYNEANRKLAKVEKDLALARDRNLESLRAEQQARRDRDTAKTGYEAAKDNPATAPEERQRLKDTYEQSRKDLHTIMDERTNGPFRDHMRADKARGQAAEDVERLREQLGTPVRTPVATSRRDQAAAEADEAQRSLLAAPGETRGATKEAAIPETFMPGAKETGKGLKDTFGSREGFWAGGVAPENEVYGHQNTAGSTGVGTGIAMEKLGPSLELDGVKGRTDEENAKWAQEMRQNVEEAKFGQALPPPPPRGLEGELDAAAERYAELDLEERRIKFQRKEVAALQESATEEMTALQAIQALADANQQAIDGEQQELDNKTEAQEKLRDKATSLGDQADQADQKHQSQAPALGAFTSKFISLMGMVPSKLVGNSGEGSGSAQQLGDGFGQGGDGAKDGKSMSTGALQHADKLGTKTDEARSSFGQSASDLQALKSLTTQCSEDTVSGQAVLAQSAASSQQKLQEIVQKKQEQRQKQETAIGTMTGWAQAHYDARTGGQEELESQLSDAEAGIEERTAETDGGGGTGGAASDEPLPAGVP